MNLKFWQKDDDPLGDLAKDFPDLSGDFSPPADQQLPPMPSFNDPAPGGQDPFANAAQQFSASPDNHPPNMRFAPADPGEARGDGHAAEKQQLLQELILARLDSIKSQLDVLNQRMTNLEGRAQGRPGGKGPWYANQ